MKATIYIAYHRPAPLISSASVVPVHAGRACATADLLGMIGDDTGTTISERNATWCELTALYWAWKNDSESDVLGLMHYRRLLDMTDRMPGGAVERAPAQLHIPDWTAEVEARLAREGDAWDILLPRLHEMGRTVEENYRAGHHRRDFDLLREIVTRDHPAYAQSFDAVARGHRVRLGNMVMMRRPLFDRYCEWLFDILLKMEAAPVDRQHYNGYQMRYLGFLAERLLTVFVHHLQATDPTLRLRETSILNLTETLVTPYLVQEQRAPSRSVNVAFSADRAYLPHVAAMLRSMLDHADPGRPLHLYFLYSGIGARGLAMLQEMLAGHPQATLHPIHTGAVFDASYRSASRAPSNATYNRFLLFDLLPGLDRLVYLDADIILRADIGKLHDTDIGQAQLAGVPDWIMTRTLTGPVSTIDPDVPDLGAYHRHVLGLSDAQIARYVNAGVLLFNFSAMTDVPGTGRALMREAREGRYLFRDQDILNRYFRQSLFLLDRRWNVFNSDAAAYARVPAPGHAEAMTAKADPWIIHYADRSNKPWKQEAIPLAQHYWQALSRTPFFGEVLGGMHLTERLPSTSPVVQAGRALAERLPMLKGPLLRLHARLNKSRSS